MGDQYDDVVDDLDAYLAGITDEPLTDEPPSDPVDEDEANRILRRIARFDREADRVNRAADAELERIEAFRTDRLSGIDRQRVWHARAIEGWMRAVNRLDPRRKTIKLPLGQVALRPGIVKVEVVDERQAVAEARAHDLLRLGDESWIRTTHAIAKTVVKPHLFAGDVVERDADGAHHQALVVIGWRWTTLMLLPDAQPLGGVRVIVPDQSTFNLKTKEA